MSDLSRRGWLSLIAGAGVFLSATPGRTQPAPGRIIQPSITTPVEFINRAFEMKRRAERSGDQSFGAVVVKNDRIIGEAPSRVVTRGDPTAHAEMEAIRDAVRRVGAEEAQGAVLYSSFRPCPMCQSAAFWAGLEGMRFGQPIQDAGRPTLPQC